MSYQVEKLLPRHQEIVEMILAGLDDVKIAEMLGIRRETVCAIRKSPRGQHEVSVRRRERQIVSDGERRSQIDEARRLVESAAADAARTHIEIMSNPLESARTRQSSATEILDLAFGRENSSGPTTINITANQVALLTEALKESQDDEPESLNA
jgi:hypothetical protein